MNVLIIFLKFQLSCYHEDKYMIIIRGFLLTYLPFIERICHKLLPDRFYQYVNEL